MATAVKSTACAISDQLREMLLKGDESENADLFSEEEQSEFLFKVFRHIALGGSMNQYEVGSKPQLFGINSRYLGAPAGCYDAIFSTIAWRYDMPGFAFSFKRPSQIL
eukprot:scaffold24098_cov32-Prasinocladus_malaysianus.AAC.1